MEILREIEFGSMLLGKEPKGCVHCRKGAKMVLLITGLCPYGCFYCPLSEKKMGKDVIYANELGVEGEGRDIQVIEEARSISAEGTGITGGDPLLVLDRTLHFIRLIKREFGPWHHIHLYTGSLPTKEQLEALKEAGLDEIRYHPIGILGPELTMELRDENLKEYIRAIRDSLECGLNTGVEIPVIPGTLEVLKWLANELDEAGTMFLNLDELEFSPTNYQALLGRGMKIRDELSSAAAGSREEAYEFMEWSSCQGFDMSIHFCSSRYKDAGQLRRRLQRRAKNIARPHEIITDDATLLKGIIEPDENLDEFAAALRKEFEIPEDLMHIDREKNRVEVAPWVLEEIARELNFPAFIVEEYPTADRLEVERERLN
ncbi:MAG: radical SAM protein [Thermoplasmata archaeon]|nr:radical SAM protein [Thermoplasmata archaeon]